MSTTEAHRILVVDDDTDGLEVLETRLSHAGYDVETGAKVCQHGDSPLQVALVPAAEEGADCRYIYYQIYCYLICPMDEMLVDGECDNPNEVLPGREIRFELEVTDFDGLEGSDSLIFLGGAETSNPTECVEDGICSGGGDTGMSIGAVSTQAGVPIGHSAR